MTRARVYKSTGSWYQVKTDAGSFIQARIKGKMKIGDISSTNPVAVGDFVMLENASDPENAVISEVCERTNYINRISPHNKKQHHIVASNLDQTLLIATVKEPRTSLGFIDRFLITAEAFHVPAIIVFNKTDLLDAEEEEELKKITAIYEAIGYKVLHTSLETKRGLEEVHALLQGKTTLLSGHSGVGKSTFINLLFPDFQLKTMEVSDWSGKGMHTTTFAEMFDLPDGGSVIDTPGIREMGLYEMEKTELAHYFPEMRERMQDCQFNNCVHINEPGCAIKKAVANEHNGISMERYMSYLTIFESLESTAY